jgi:hypothetical protein
LCQTRARQASPLRTPACAPRIPTDRLCQPRARHASPLRDDLLAAHVRL